MKSFDCDFFTLVLDERIKCFWSTEQPEYLNLFVNDFALARLSISTGLYADKGWVEDSIRRAVAERGGYLGPMDEDYPDEHMLLIDDPHGRVSEHHLLRYGAGWAIHINIYDNYHDGDIEVLRSVISAMDVHVDPVLAAGDHIRHPLKISDSTVFSTIGSRQLLEEKRYEG